MISQTHKVYLALLDGYVPVGVRVFDSRADALRYANGKPESVVERALVRPSGFRYTKPKTRKTSK